MIGCVSLLVFLYEGVEWCYVGVWVDYDYVVGVVGW